MRDSADQVGSGTPLAPLRFSLRQLQYFVVTCEVESVTEAAQSIPVSQSSVSAAISQLEAALGMQLLVRHHARGVSPTPAGRRFLARARELLREADELERFAWELTGSVSGPLDLGCLVTIAPLIAPRLAQSFSVEHPAVSVGLVEAGQLDLLERLRTGSLSVVLTYDLQLGDDISFAALCELPPLALLPLRHPLAGGERVSLSELAGEPLVLLDLPLSREYFYALFHAEGLNPTVRHRSPNPEVIRALVANGYGYTLVNARPTSEEALDGGRLRILEISEPARPVVLGLATLATARPTRLVSAFMEHCRNEIQRGTMPGVHRRKRELSEQHTNS